MKKTTLVFVPSPGIGHLIPTLEFAMRLLDQSDEITITVLVMTMPLAPPVDTYVRSLTASRSRIEIVDLPLVEGPPIELLIRSTEAYICEFIESNRNNVRNAISEMVSAQSGSLDPICIAGIVIDFFCVSMINIANEFGLPSYIYLTSNAGFLSLMLYLPGRDDQTGTEFTFSDPEVAIPGFKNPVPASVMPSACFNKEGGYTCYVNVARRFKDAKGIAVNTFAELETYAMDSLLDGQNPRVYSVGPVLNLKGHLNPEMDQAKWGEIMKWLDKQPKSSAVFLCFGSLGTFTEPQVKEIALGVERSGYNFLWYLRLPPVLPEVEATFVVPRRPEDMLPEGFLERTKGRGMICGWAPQVEVLSHRAIGGFVSHCGWNSTLESLWCGVPQATLPIFAEQQLNAFKMVKELGLAVELKLDSRPGGDLVTAEVVCSGIKALMDENNEVRKKVKEMSTLAKQALTDGGSSFSSIAQFLKDVLQNC